MMRFTYLALIFLAAIVVGLYAGPDAAEAHTAPSGSFYTLVIREDRFVNWDFRSQNSAASNVDWPVTMLYYNNANINKVKDKLDAIQNIGRCGSGNNALLTDNINASGGGWVWDSDGGIKDNCGTSSDQTRHMRVYADGDDKLYNLSFSYYIIGTTHVDHCHEHGVWPFQWCHHHWVGFSETANDWWDYYSRQVSGWTVYADYANFSNTANFDDLHGDGEDHYVRSNGYATYVYVP